MALPDEFKLPYSRNKQERRAVARKPRNAAAVLYGYYKPTFEFESHVSSSKRTGAKQNLTQNGDSMRFEVSGKALRD